ncbi:hypothetical protein [Streptomyces tubercidicus]|uniref:nSTAND1 domain-containing NTPase n=1 Tax=Streptomyces tubercidicus TaxID=47759 RepID=UPI002E143F20|nr:hypothetical protein OG761_31285 [Streptomyces tubercidicus]
MNAAGELPEGGEGIGLEAQASDRARIYQARRDLYVSERDLHVHYVDGVRTARRGEPGAGPEECPYPGLAAFDAQQAQWFFGRDGLTADLLVRLDERLWAGGPLAVAAPSGAGKSSLLRAGLLPALARGALPVAGSARWPCAVLTPTAHPLDALAPCLVRVAGVSPQRAAEVLADGPEACVAMLRAALLEETGGEYGTRRRWVVVVDQLEELFTVCTSKEEADAFLDVLGAIAEAGPAGEGPAGLVVFGLRSDFYTQCADQPRLRATLQDSPVVVGPMSEAEVREAILFPARVVGLEVEPGLVEVLLRDLGAHARAAATGAPDGPRESGGYEAGRLPLLAHALRATWQQRHAHVLTVEGYRATGGIAHAIATTADSVYACMDPPGRRATRALLLRLVKIGSGVEDTRRRLPYTDLAGHGDSAVPAAIIESFTQARLLTRERDSVEITHEVLLRAWPRLRHWIEDDRADNLIRQELEEAAADWEHAGRDAGMLYRGSRLQAARSWATKARHEEQPGSTGVAFLAASLWQQQHTDRLRRAVISVLAVLVLIASSAAVIAFRQRATAQTERDTAIFNQVSAEADQLRNTDGSLAAQLDLVAHHMRPKNSKIYTDLVTAGNVPLSTPLTGHTSQVTSTAFSPDGHTLASGSDDATIRLWDVSDPTHPGQLGRPLTGHTDAVESVAFSPDGHTLASGSEDGRIRLWDVSDPTHPGQLGRPLTGHTDTVESVAFSPDGHTLASGSEDRTIRLWDVTDPAHRGKASQVLTGHAEAVNGVAFSPDGRTLASASEDTTVRLWNLSGPARTTVHPHIITGPTSAFYTVAFSPDGGILASAGNDRTVRLWDVRDPAHIKQLGQPLIGHTRTIYSVAFSPDGHTLASASNDTTVRLWNISYPYRSTPLGRPFPGLTGHTNTVRSVAFSPDGHTLVSAGNDHTIRLWNMPQAPLIGHYADVESAAFSPDRRTLATGSDDRMIRLWDVAGPGRATALGPPLTGSTKAVESVAFSPDGHILASGSNDRTVRLWDVTDPAHPRELGSALTGHTDTVRSVAFSPDGRTLASGSNDRTIRLWDVTEPAHPRELGSALTGHTGTVYTVAFSPDGRTLASGSNDRTIRLWDVTDPTRTTPIGSPLTNHTDTVFGVAFSPDRHTLASAGADATIRLWNVTDPTRTTPVGRPLTGHTGGVFSVAFSRDGHTLASGATDGTARLWDVTDPTGATPLGQSLAEHSGTLFSVALSPDGHTLASGSADGTARLWELDIDRVTQRICTTTRNTLTRDQWRRYVSAALPYNPPCP